MADRHGSETRQRTALVAIRFLPAERSALQATADARGVSVSWLIRASVLSAIGYEVGGSRG